jgi:hypothetical protein
MVRTVDNRQYFTELGNFPQLIEFSKAQNAEVSVVKLQEQAQVMSLPQLAKSLCDPNYKSLDPKYELVERKITLHEGKKPRQRLLAQAQEIRHYIENTLKAGNAVSLVNISERFKDYNLGEAALRKHLMYVRLKMAKDGLQVDKVEVGTYRICGRKPLLSEGKFGRKANETATKPL